MADDPFLNFGEQQESYELLEQYREDLAKDAREMLAQGADFVLIGRAAILHHDFPELSRDPAFEPIALPVSRQHLVNEGLGPAFVDYMATWKGFIQEPVDA